MLTNIPGLVAAFYTGIPDAENQEEKVVFGTSGHRGTSLKNTFNEWHILAICQAICMFRVGQKTDGPLFMGMDTHALSVPAFSTALEVLAANGVQIMISKDDEFTPTPAVSHAILTYNKGRTSGFADGIIITPSHNPPGDGGFKYNPPSGGPAPDTATAWIENKANEMLSAKLKGVKRISLARALHISSTHRYDYLNTYVDDLHNIINMEAISGSGLKIGVDALGGAGMHYWEPIAKRYGLNLTVFNQWADPTFAFMPVDWDGQIRMDPSSEYAMQNLIGLKNKFDISIACDTDYDRHGIVTGKSGLLPPNHYLSVMIDYLFKNRPLWSAESMVGKTVVSSQMIDRVSARLRRKVYEVPVGFKWYADGLLDGSLGFCGEESAGASFARINREVWTTDKDGIIAALLSAEILAVTKQDPGEIYNELSRELGTSYYDRIEAAATTAQKQLLSKVSTSQFDQKQLAGEKITSVITNAPGNGASIGGLKVSTENGWFAARPSGTEQIYKIYAESFVGEEHLKQILAEAQIMVDNVLK
ncbi:phosphoglucomutase, alpha-D-glucose phosphate-specific [Dyadobacter frigoris]|nr:phosphoglucomutase, alpha-D-glucose phosphate-specific [Dyadobacter frigoris]